MQISPNLHFQVILQVDLWPWFVTFWPHEHMKVPISYQYTQCGSNLTSTFQMRPFSHFQPILQLHLRWFDLGIWPLTTWTYEGSHIIYQVWFHSDFNFSMRPFSHFQPYLITWPQMTFDLGIWPLTTWTYVTRSREWVTCRQFSILIFQYISFVHLKCYISIQTPSQSDIWLQRFEHSLKFKNNV